MSTEFFDLSHPQKRIWYNEKMHSMSSANNIGGTVYFRGKAKPELIKESLLKFIELNDNIRIQIKEVDGVHKQYIKSFNLDDIKYVDFSRNENAEQAYITWSKKEFLKPFSIEDTPLYEFVVFKISDSCLGFFGRLHHIISDGWSITILVNSIQDIYKNLINNNDEFIINTVDNYSTYLEEENRYLVSNRFEKDKLFWESKYKELPEPLIDSKLLRSLTGSRKEFFLDSITTRAIKHYLKEYGYSMPVFFYAITGLMFSRFYTKKSMVIGVPVANRNKNTKDIFGMCTNMVPMEFELNDDMTLHDLLKYAKREMSSCLIHQKYPYENLIHDLKLRSKNYNDFYSISFNYYNTKPYNELEDIKIEISEYYPGEQSYALQVIVKEWIDDNISISFDYQNSIFNDDIIMGFFEYLNHLIYEFLKNSKQRAINTSIISEKTKNELIYGYNNTVAKYPEEKTVIKLFEEVAKKYPDKIALSFNDECITFGELNRKSNCLAHCIREKYKRKGVIGIIGKHSIELITGIIGILKSGSSFLPLDYKHPKERNSYILQDAGVELLLANIDIDKYLDYNEKVIDLNQSELYEGQYDNNDIKVDVSDIAYIIYTSGSTGKPKGVLVKHSNLTNYIWWASKMYVKNIDDVFACYSSIAFDLTITSIFVPLISGIEMRIYADDEKEHAVKKIINDNKVSIIKLTPSHLALIKEYSSKESKFRTFILGGENLKTKDALDIKIMFGNKVDIYNEYGPTEATVGCMIYNYNKLKDKGAYVPIGIPIDNVKLYVLDNNLNLMPPNSVGELYISGASVTAGYLNNERLTHERYMSDPFNTGLIMYKTGDLARITNNGFMECLGRKDNQVKINGYRIEIGEIEDHIINFKGVKNTTVIPVEIEGAKELCAYIVGDKIDTSQLSSELLNVLPSYMVPKFIIPVEEIPLTVNGKVNKDLLPSPNEVQKKLLNNNHYKSMSISEEVIKAVKRVLEVDSVSFEDNFFNLGGDSIKAIQLSSALNNVGIKLRVEDILLKPVLKYMITSCKEQYRVNIQDDCTGEICMTPIIYNFINCKDYKEPEHYNQSILLELISPLDSELIEECLKKIIRQHDAFRINYSKEKNRIFYNPNISEKDFKLLVYDLKNIDELEFDKRIAEIGEEIKASIDINNGLLIKACLFKSNSYNDILLLTAHHLAIDGVSWRIIYDDFDSLIYSHINKKDKSLMVKTNSFKVWSENLTKQGNEIFANEKNYWTNIINDYSEVNMTLPIKCSNLQKRRNINFTFSDDMTSYINKNTINSYNIKMNEFLEIILALTISKCFETKIAAFCIESHGRQVFNDKIDISRTVGWFTSMYPISFNIGDKKDIGEIIRYVKEKLRSIPNNGIGFGILSNSTDEFRINKNKKIIFNYLGELDNSFANSYFKLSHKYSGEDISSDNILNSIMEINCMLVDGKLQFNIYYNDALVNKSFMEYFKQVFFNNADTIIKHCNEVSKEFTPSDFTLADLSQEELNSLFE